VISEITQREAIRDIHDRVRQCFTRHKFVTFGDALSWWHKTDFETQELEAGEQGMSKFSTEILWLIASFGPKEPVDYKVMATRKVPALKPVAVDNPEDEPEDELKVTDSQKTSRPRRKISRRRRRF